MKLYFAVCVRSYLQSIGNEVFEVVLCKVHIISQVSECNLRLNHPELSKVSGCVAVLSSEGGPKGVHIAHCTAVRLHCVWTHGRYRHMYVTDQKQRRYSCSCQAMKIIAYQPVRYMIQKSKHKAWILQGKADDTL